MSDDTKSLRPATREDVEQGVAFALRYHGKKRWHRSDDIMAQITAKHLVDYLELSGFVLMRKSGAQLHSATFPRPISNPLKD